MTSNISFNAHYALLPNVIFSFNVSRVSRLLSSSTFLFLNNITSKHSRQVRSISSTILIGVCSRHYSLVFLGRLPENYWRSSLKRPLVLLVLTSKAIGCGLRRHRLAGTRTHEFPLVRSATETYPSISPKASPSWSHYPIGVIGSIAQAT
jgi:hypothetical protein